MVPVMTVGKFERFFRAETYRDIREITVTFEKSDVAASELQ
jgi:hypothetical protein